MDDNRRFYTCNAPVKQSPPTNQHPTFCPSVSTLLVGQQEGHPARKKVGCRFENDQWYTFYGNYMTDRFLLHIKEMQNFTDNSNHNNCVILTTLSFSSSAVIGFNSSTVRAHSTSLQPAIQNLRAHAIKVTQSNETNADTCSSSSSRNIYYTTQ